MKKVAVLLDDGYHDLELWIPYYRLKEEKIIFDILAWEDRKYTGIFGIDSVMPDKLLSHERERYQLVYLPGAKSPENLLKRPETVEIIKRMHEEGSQFATICHSPIVLAEAGLLKGKSVTGHPSIKSKIEAAGASYVDSPVVRSSDHIISGRTHFEMDSFLPELLNQVKN
ncbi:MAG: DJ-1/PfpI family protein [Candidatus Thermoplasmatota archaeon]|jgi:protease I|nr:DJ-1/PfpI family protein [Candidatus Thermoplasmatota archaeon]